MVYNAMKLFMEINPQLFDECSDQYRESEANAAQNLQNRKDKWNAVVDQARRNSNGEVTAPPLTDRAGKKFDPSTIGGKINEEDPITQDSQQRLDALRLQDEGGGSQGRKGRSGGNGSAGEGVCLCPLSLFSFCFPPTMKVIFRLD